MYAIGIDIGTTNICGIVLDTESGEIISSRTEESHAFLPTTESWEKIQDVNTLTNVVIDILDSFSCYPASVIGLTGQMHGILYYDQEGNAVSPLYTWQDERGNLPFRDTTYAAFLDSNSGYGNVTDFYNCINGIRPENAVGYCTVMDYLGMVLCGLKSPRIHATNAASLGGYDLEARKCILPAAGKDFLREAGCPDLLEKLNNNICHGFELLGTYRGIPVSVAIGDNQASVLSTLADENKLLLNIGTGSQVSRIAPSPIEGDGFETRPYFEGKYLLVGAALCGGRAYGLLKDFYSRLLEVAGADTTNVYGLMAKLLDFSTEKDTYGGICVDTRFAGTRNNPEQTGSISRITTGNFTPELLTRGFLEGMVDELYAMYQQMSHKNTAPGTDLVGSGNGIRKNPYLVKAAEKRFSGSLSTPVHREEAAFGAALFSLVSCGAFRNIREAQQLIRYQE